MTKESAGILLYRKAGVSEATQQCNEIEVFLVHPGGPFFGNKDRGIWSIPKGLIEEGEDRKDAAIREFEEETGFRLEGGELVELGEVKQKGGKIVFAWASECPSGTEIEVRSNTFEMEWPPRSGRKQQFPEIDRGEFFPLKTAMEKINPSQRDFILRLKEHTRRIQ